MSGSTQKKKQKSKKQQEQSVAIAVGLLCFLIAGASIMFMLKNKSHEAGKKDNSIEQQDTLSTSSSREPSGSSTNENGRLLRCNADGQSFNLSSTFQSGKQNIFYFHSKGCPACRQMEPLVRKLASARPDLAVFLVDIDRRDSEEEIDFHSPVANQFNLDRVPYFKIYDGTSHLVVAKGSEAKQMVKEMMVKENIAR